MNREILKAEILEAHIEYIKSEIINNISCVSAIFLCGSYGRNEGAWIEDVSGGIRPYNDYDFIVVTGDSSISKEKLNALRKKCAEVVNINWVDIDIYSKGKLANLRITQKNVDIANGSRLVYGKSVQWDRTRLDADKLGKYDIEILYFTRLWTFWCCYPMLKSEKIENDSALIFNYQMAKAVLACADAFLIKEKKYKTSYADKVDCVCALPYIGNAEADLFRWALQTKLEPSGQIIYQDIASKLFNSVVILYYKAMDKGLGGLFKLYGSKRLAPMAYYIHPRHLIVHVYHAVKGMFAYDRKFRSVMNAQNRLFMDLYAHNIPDKNTYEKILHMEIPHGGVEEIVRIVGKLRNEL